MPEAAKHIGIVSTRLAGPDGVSLEARKWVEVLTRLGHECFYLAGECEWSAERSQIVPEAHFTHPEIRTISRDLFDDAVRSPEVSASVDRLKSHLKGQVRRFVQAFDLDLLIVENALAVPMNVPLGLALTEFAAESRLPTIAHHHDFAWERPRFSVHAAGDYLDAAFPPKLPAVTHVVINSYAQNQLALRKGISSIIIPNVMDFESPPPEANGHAGDLRAALGIEPGEYFILQPTRVVPRKRIEQAIRLAARLGLPNTLVVSHSAGDEGEEYADFLRETVELLGAKVRFAARTFNGHQGQTDDGRKAYSLADAYLASDLVTYPSVLEGFGNAFLEALYYRRPLVMSDYLIYRTDIRPKGFQVVEFDDYVTGDTVRQAREVLLHPERTAAVCQRNYEIASRHYSYSNLERLLAALLTLSVGH